MLCMSVKVSILDRFIYAADLLENVFHLCMHGQCSHRGGWLVGGGGEPRQWQGKTREEVRHPNGLK